MKERATVQGIVDVVITRANGKQEFYSGQNTVESAVKNAVASSLNAAHSGGYGVLNSAFDGSDTGFSSIGSGVDGQSGIIVKTTASDYYEAETVAASSGNTGKVVKVVGTIKANASKTIDIAYLGHGQDSGSDVTYGVLVSTHDFSSNIALTDGDQLDITWTVTIADN